MFTEFLWEFFSQAHHNFSEHLTVTARISRLVSYDIRCAYRSSLGFHQWTDLRLRYSGRGLDWLSDRQSTDGKREWYALHAMLTSNTVRN
jgi:hypothetical protein